MKQGERPPDGLKNMVIRLAGRAPRLSNPVIQAAVKERFGEDVSHRTIGRYCQEAGLPSSSRGTEELGESHEYRPIAADPLLVSRRQQHQDDICSLAAAEREEIFVPEPNELTRDILTLPLKRNWVVDYQGRWTLPAEQHELYPFLQDHLKADDLWQDLDHLRAKLPEYQQQGEDLLADIEYLATSRIYAHCPVASSSDAMLPNITLRFAGLVYYEAVSMAMGISDPIQEPYILEPQGEGVVSLKIHASYIAYDRDIEGLERLKLAHRRLRKKCKGQPSPKRIVEQYHELVEIKKSIRHRLEPNLVRQLVYRGNCERCP